MTKKPAPRHPARPRSPRRKRVTRSRFQAAADEFENILRRASAPVDDPGTPVGADEFEAILRRAGAPFPPATPAVTAAELEAMLRAAGAPFPLAAPELCDQAARRIDNVRVTLARWRRTPLGHDAATARATAATDEWLRVQGRKKLWGDRRRIGIIVGRCN